MTRSARASLPVLAVTAALLVLQGCGESVTPPEPPPAPVPPAAQSDAAPDDASGAGSYNFEAYAYDCRGLRIAVRPGDGELHLVLPDRTLVLPQVEAASGARYQAGDDAFWGKGINTATLTLDGEDTPCLLDRQATPWVDARARGVQFRAIGQEPGWQLEVHPDRLVFMYQYGEKRAVAPNDGPSSEPEHRLRHWQASTAEHELAISVEERACTDVMSGEVYPATVVVNLDGRDYSGCGRNLE
jgi:uncharacterized membrane protein/membrane-bound inhibitor of C-type lysozyme